MRLGHGGRRWKSVSPGQNDSLARDMRSEVTRREKRTNQRNPYRVGKARTAAICVEHLDRIRDKGGTIVAFNLRGQRVGVGLLDFWLGRLLRAEIGNTRIGGTLIWRP